MTGEGVHRRAGDRRHRDRAEQERGQNDPSPDAAVVICFCIESGAAPRGTFTLL